MENFIFRTVFALDDRRIFSYSYLREFVFGTFYVHFSWCHGSINYHGEHPANELFIFYSSLLIQLFELQIFIFWFE